MNRPAWMDDALCAQVGGDYWYPDKGGSVVEGKSFALQAKRICKRCDVRAECLEYALENDERNGIWGGLAPRARRHLGKGDAA